MSETNQNDPPVISNAGEDATSVARQSIEGIFVEALDKTPPDERRVFLDSACEGNAETRRRVEALLAAYDDAGSFLQHAAGDWKNPPLPAGSAPDSPGGGIPPGLLSPSDKPGCLGMLGPYEVLQFLGRGGMGIVLRALDPQLNRVVAVKVLAPELAVDVASRRRFLREARAAAAISHPHVVTIHAVAVDDERFPYLVMECIVGRTLQQKIDQNGPLKLKEILRIGTQVAEGLAVAHKQGLVHRDIKPANVLLENGIERVKITDFGLARSVDDVSITRTGEVSGTPQYMSPEQAHGKCVDQRSDLFSLGCVLYAMCTGRPPFRGENVAVVVKQICDEAPRPIAEINPDIPGWLIQTIDRLLAKDPAQRFQSASDVADVLSGHLAHAQQPHGGHVPKARLASLQSGFAEHLVSGVAYFVPAAGPAKPVSNGQLVAAIAVAGLLLGRVIPIYDLEGALLVLLLSVASSAFLFKRGVAAGLDNYRVAGWIMSGALAAFAGFGIGTEIHDYRRGDVRFSDYLLFGFGIFYLIHIARCWTRHSTAAVDGTAESPAVQTAMTPAEQPQGSAARPWKMAGWLMVAVLGLVLLIPCGLAVGLLVPMFAFRLAEAERGTLTIEYDNNKAPIQEIRLRGGDLPGERRFPVDSMPFRIRLAPGQYTLTATELLYDDAGQRVATVQPMSFTIEKGKEARLQLGPVK